MEPSPLFLPGWIAYQERKWRLTPHLWRFGKDPANPPAAEGLYWLDRRGRLCLPPGCAYMPLAFTPSPSPSPPARHRQWLALSEQIAEDMARRGLAGPIALPPEVEDARLWQWAGFRVGVRYTFHHDLPFDERGLDPATRKNAEKAARAGYTCERTVALEAVHACLVASERRQGFSHRLTLEDMRLARALVGDQHLLAYVCRAPDGAVASAKVALHRPGARALIWLSGSDEAHLASGATQLLTRFVFEDLGMIGASGCDFAGANLAGVALQKSKWGGRLVPYFTVEAPDARGLAKYMRDCFRYAKRSTEPGPCLKGF